MAEPPGSQSALGIEAVEWLPTGESSVTVVVTGRWRRRPSWQGRPVLVIETHGRRHRFPAIPDPPSVAGAAPGTWRMTFSIPAWLAPQLGGRAWLQMGVVVVPLPPVVEPHEAEPAEAPAAREGPEAREGLEAREGPEQRGFPPHPEPRGFPEHTGPPEAHVPERETRTAEPQRDAQEAEPPEAETRRAEPPAAEASEPTDAESMPQRRTSDLLAAAAELTETIKELDAERRMAAARAEAEQRLRSELEQQLTAARQRAQEAERLAAAAERERGQRVPEAMRAAMWRTRLAAELELARGAPPVQLKPGADGMDGEAARLARRQLRREQDAAQAAELDRWRARTMELERKLHESALRAERLYDVIEDLRAVLDIIRGVPKDEADGNPEGEANGKSGAPGGEASGNPEASGENPGTVAADNPAATHMAPLLEADRLDAALGRLRDSIPPVEEEQAPPEDGVGQAEDEPQADDEAPVAGQGGGDDQEIGPKERAAAGDEQIADERRAASDEEQIGPDQLPPPAPPTRKSWLLRALRRLAKQDANAAGRVALGVLRAQRLASERRLSYDLSLADAGCFQITSTERGTEVARAKATRRREDVDFQLTGELATFARLLVAGPIRRRSGRGVAELRGDPKALRALLALIRTPYGLRELYAAGARLEPQLAFMLLASMIEPRWTAGYRFTVAHRGPERSVYLRVLGDARPTVTAAAPLAPVAATIVCEPDDLLAVFVAERSQRAAIRGRREVVELLRGWISQAQGS